MDLSYSLPRYGAKYGGAAVFVANGVLLAVGTWLVAASGISWSDWVRPEIARAQVIALVIWLVLGHSSLIQKTAAGIATLAVILSLMLLPWPQFPEFSRARDISYAWIIFFGAGVELGPLLLDLPLELALLAAAWAAVRIWCARAAAPQEPGRQSESQRPQFYIADLLALTAAIAFALAVPPVLAPYPGFWHDLPPNFLDFYGDIFRLEMGGMFVWSALNRVGPTLLLAYGLLGNGPPRYRALGLGIAWGLAFSLLMSGYEFVFPGFPDIPMPVRWFSPGDLAYVATLGLTFWAWRWVASGTKTCREARLLNS